MRTFCVVVEEPWCAAAALTPTPLLWAAAAVVEAADEPLLDED